MDSKTILLVGGSGFIGTRLTDRLLKGGHSVKIYDKVRSSEFPDLCSIGDVRDRAALSAAAEGIDVIYNLAAEHRDDVRPSSLYDEVNVGGAENLVAAAEEHDIRQIIFTSTVAVYPFSQSALDETAEPAPFNDYGRTKLLAEKVHRRWLRQSADRSLAIFRPTAVFGEGNRGNVYNLINQIARGKFIMIGAGKNRKSIAYVENVAEALMFVMSLGPGEHVFNYADEPDMDMNTLVTEIRRALGQTPTPGVHLPKWLGLLVGHGCDIAGGLLKSRLPVSKIRVEKFCANTQFDSSRIRNAGFVAQYDLAEALCRTIEAEFVGSHS